MRDSIEHLVEYIPLAGRITGFMTFTFSEIRLMTFSRHFFRLFFTFYNLETSADYFIFDSSVGAAISLPFDCLSILTRVLQIRFFDIFFTF